MARAWGVLPDQLRDLDAGTYLAMVAQLADEIERRQQSDG